MVWQYTEYYPGCPYLEDWVNGEFAFGIEVAENFSHTTTEDAVVGGKLREVEVIHSDGVPEPRFYLIGNNSDRPYQLILSLTRGLERRIVSTVDEGMVGTLRAINLKTRRLGIGGFDDFKAIGKYAVERFPKIAQEIVYPPTDFPREIPEDHWPQIQQSREQCLDVLDWDSTVRDISRRFRALFGTYLIGKVETGNGVVMRMGDEKFTPAEIQELYDLIEPLR